MISTISKHLNTVIPEENIDRSLRARKFNPVKTKQRPVTVKFAPIMFITKCSLQKPKLKGKGTSTSERLTKLCLVKLNEAREQHIHGNVWFYDGKIMYKDINNKVFYD